MFISFPPHTLKFWDTQAMYSLPSWYMIPWNKIHSWYCTTTNTIHCHCPFHLRKLKLCAHSATALYSLSPSPWQLLFSLHLTTLDKWDWQNHTVFYLKRKCSLSGRRTSIFHYLNGCKWSLHGAEARGLKVKPGLHVGDRNNSTRAITTASSIFIRRKLKF